MTNTTTPGESDDHAPTPAQSVALIDEGGRAASRKLDWAGRFIFGLWGAVWATSATTFYLTLPGGPELILRPTAVVGVSALAGLALAASIVLGIRANRDVRGPSRTAGAWQGWTWLLGFGAILAMNAALTAYGLPDDVMALVWSGTSLIMVGVLTLTTAAWHQDRYGYALGIWLLTGGVLSVIVGVPHSYLVLGLVGGSGMILYVARPATGGTRG